MEDRILDTLADGFKAIPYSSYAGNESEYFVLNYFGADDYLGNNILTTGVPGHIAGAYQFTPYESLGIDQMLENLPTDKKILVYCWTGQHSAQIAFYLNMLGYDAFSLKFGSNALFHASLLDHSWVVGTPDVERPTEEIPTPLPVYQTLGDELSDYFMAGPVPGLIKAFNLRSDLLAGATYTLLDVRKPEDFALGHIENAINVSVADLISEIEAGNIPTENDFVVTCYTGQSAGYAKAALDLLGYDAVSLKWGMCSWNNTLTTKWDDATDSPATPSVVDENGGLEWNLFPALDENDDVTVLDNRLDVVMAEGFQGVSYGDIELEDYFVVTYWDEFDYMGTAGNGHDARTSGHLEGSYQFTPGTSLDFDTMLANLPSGQEDSIIVYCWSGQTSAQITMYLRMMGYDAYSMMFGANSLFFDDIDNAKWSSSETHRSVSSLMRHPVS